MVFKSIFKFKICNIQGCLRLFRYGLTDPHDSSGAHWFSLYIDLKGVNNKPCIYYFDSIAAKPKDLSGRTSKACPRQCLKINKDVRILFNDAKTSALKNTGRGVYCLHFFSFYVKR